MQYFKVVDSINSEVTIDTSKYKRLYVQKTKMDLVGVHSKNKRNTLNHKLTRLSVI
jgi:hypothetical protein